MSFVERLPPEITTVIFKQCIPPLSKRPGDSYPRSSDAPLVLTVVCSSWRAFLLDCPTPWTNLFLTNKIKVPGVVQRVREWYTRSKGSPGMQVSLRQLPLEWVKWARAWHPDEETRRELQAEYDTHWRALIQVTLVEHSEIIQDLRLYVSDVKGSQIFFDIPSGSLCNLESLTLEIDNYNSRFPTTVFAAAHRLRRVSLCFHSGLLLDPEVPDGEALVLPWAQLTELILPLKPVYPAMLSNVLYRSPNLRKLALVVTGSALEDNAFRFVEGPLVAPHLRELALCLSSGPPANLSLLDNVVLPSLSCLIIQDASTALTSSFFHWNMTRTPTHFLHQIRQLRKLSLEGPMPHLTGNVLLDILAFVPLLEDLQLDATIPEFLLLLLRGLTWHQVRNEARQDHDNSSSSTTLLSKLSTFGVHFNEGLYGNLSQFFIDMSNFNVDFVAMVISRSPHLTLEVSLDEKGVASSPTCELFASISQPPGTAPGHLISTICPNVQIIQSPAAILDHPEAIQKLYLSVVNMDGSKRVFQASNDPFTNIEVLELQIQKGRFDPSRVSVSTTTPKLRRVCIGISPLKLPHGLEGEWLSWSQLTSLGRARRAKSTLITIIQHCPDLRKMALQVNEEGEAPDVQDRLLHAVFASLECGRVVTHQRTFPCSPTSGCPPFLFSLFKTFLHLLHLLRSLSLRGMMHLKTPALLTVLEHVPLLEELEIDVVVAGILSLFRSLTVSQGDQADGGVKKPLLVPLLHSFGLFINESVTYYVGAAILVKETAGVNTHLVAMIASRGPRPNFHHSFHDGTSNAQLKETLPTRLCRRPAPCARLYDFMVD
ncbi:unnamed protein product [Cyclocybe aegerita]|uniref:F-box domain-containing protein n=1 Tax=Cyclocybe aegerita TaxID=1973307 RepID=A0A8S0XKS7_CYCAE|nr:unnamed protein product [Cyclocybe aegerita]